MTLDQVIDEELEARLRRMYAHVVPLLAEQRTNGTRDERVDKPAVDLEVVESLRMRQPRRRTGWAAAGLAAAAVVGLVAVTTDTSGNIGTSPAGTELVSPTAGPSTAGAHPLWYEMIRPYVPERFAHMQLEEAGPDQIRLVAIEPATGKSLHIGIGLPSAFPPPTPFTVDQVGSWSEMPIGGWHLVTADTGLRISAFCSIGVNTGDDGSLPRYCDMESAGPFDSNQVRAVVTDLATHLDLSLFDAGLNDSPPRSVNIDIVTAMVLAQLPDENFLQHIGFGVGDHVLEFSSDGGIPADLWIGLQSGLTPPPAATTQAQYGLYDDAATFWMFGPDGTAIRITTTRDTSAEALARLEQVGARLLANIDDWSVPAATVAPAPSDSTAVEGSTDAPINATVFAAPITKGATGEDVARFQTRLRELGFDPGAIDGVFGATTQQAVWAYKKLVMGVPSETLASSDNATEVTPEMWLVMQEPITIRPRRPQDVGSSHVEIYLPQQVLAVFTDDKPVLVAHISSGDDQPWCEQVSYDIDANGQQLDEPVVRDECGVSYTPGGEFTIGRRYEGNRQTSIGGMYNPVFFNYGIAVHGAVNVPLYPVSHGAIRINMTLADLLPTLIDDGDTVYVWGQDGREPEQYSDSERLPIFNYRTPPTTTG